MISEQQICDITSHILNKILLEEREVFRSKHFEETAVFLHKNGKDKRVLKTRAGNLSLEVPRLRGVGISDVYSVIDKYKRSTEELNNSLMDLYINRSPTSFMKSILNRSRVPNELREKLINEYLEKYKQFENRKVEGYKMFKLDSTYILDKNGNKKSLYFLMGIKDYSYKIVNRYLKDEHKNYIRDEFGKCLRRKEKKVEFNKNIVYYYVEDGNEGREAWERMFDFMEKNIDMTDTEIIVSDMKQEIKNLLHERFPDIYSQNCLFHRLQSVYMRAKGLRLPEKKKITARYWKRLKAVNTIKSAREIINELREVKQNKRMGYRGKYIYPNIDKMIDWSFDDNFNYIKMKDRNWRNLAMHNNCIEGLFSRLKRYLKKTVTATMDNDIITARIMMYLCSNNWIEEE